jgi:hypothetical protein
VVREFRETWQNPLSGRWHFYRANGLTSWPKRVHYDAVGHCCFVCLSASNLDIRRVAMATNGEWKVLVDILYCVA